MIQSEVFRPDGPIIHFMLQTHAPTAKIWHWWDTLFALAILAALFTLILLSLGYFSPF